MTNEKKALVLSYVHCSLAVKNLEVAVHEARIDKDPEYRVMAVRLKKLQDAMDHTFKLINKKYMREGVSMEQINEEIEEIQDRTWDEPELEKEL